MVLRGKASDTNMLTKGKHETRRRVAREREKTKNVDVKFVDDCRCKIVDVEVLTEIPEDVGKYENRERTKSEM